MDINIQGLHNVLELSRIHSLRVFAPSSIAAFGPDTPQIANHLQRVRSGLPPLDKSACFCLSPLECISPF